METTTASRFKIYGNIGLKLQFFTLLQGYKAADNFVIFNLHISNLLCRINVKISAYKYILGRSFSSKKGQHWQEKVELFRVGKVDLTFRITSKGLAVQLSARTLFKMFVHTPTILDTTKFILSLIGKPYLAMFARNA